MAETPAREAIAVTRPSPWQLVLDVDMARQIRVWRVDEGCTWRGVASAATERWCSEEDTNQMLGVELCRAAAELLGEDHRREPWN